MFILSANEISPRRSVRRHYCTPSFVEPWLWDKVGAIRAISSTQPILLKNIGDASISLAAWYVLGHGIAFGEDVGHVIGKPTFFSTGERALRGGLVETTRPHCFL